MRNKILVMLPVFLFLTGMSLSYSLSGNNDKIVWSAAHRLTFDDFLGSPDEDTLYFENDLENLGLAKISKALIMHTKVTGKRTKFDIYAAMDRTMSWIKSNTDIASLRHEQGHFDITEIFARKLRKEISHAKSIFDAKTIYWQVVAEEEHEQNEYDKDNSGSTEGINEYWSARIQNLLEEYKVYENPEVVVEFR